MVYRTRLELTGGDRTALDAAAAKLRSSALSKGAEVAGPHTKPSRTLTVPLLKRIDDDELFDTWEYEVFIRELTITGHDTVARTLAAESLPSSVSVSLTIDLVTAAGAKR